jgi:hypothetical protein
MDTFQRVKKFRSEPTEVYEDGGFTCNAGSYKASIHCTSGGDCICTGADCDQIGGGGALGKVGNSKGKILARFPQNLTSQDKAQMQRLVEQSLNAIKDRQGETAVQTIRGVRVLARRASGNSPWETCGDHCQHFLDEGKPLEYAYCYWACVARGGPVMSGPFIK